jgi:hypothetical protein
MRVPRTAARISGGWTPGAAASKARSALSFDMYAQITGEDPYQVPMRIYPAVHYVMGGVEPVRAAQHRVADFLELGVGFSVARRTIRARTPAGIAGLPGEMPGVVQRRRTSCRCQRRIVAGVTRNPRRRRAGSRRARAAMTARSLQLIRGRGVRRCNTACETVALDDEWPDRESFESFFHEQESEIRPMFESMNVSSEVEPTFWRELETHDAYGWSD